MKKLLTLLLAAAMTASFAGCTTTNANDQASSKGETASGEKKEITFLTYNLSIASQKDAVQELIDTFNAQSDTVQVTGYRPMLLPCKQRYSLIMWREIPLM